MYRERYGEERRFTAPVKVGEELTVTIEAVGEKGDGIAKVKGFVIFVPNTKQGDHPKIKVTRVLKSVAFGEVVGSAESSEEETDKSSEEESVDSEDEEMNESSEEEPAEEESSE
ncbi:MAG TPA: TRAM domain-containing protein [Candidatus Nanoarchaeia archaeon]|nr:TRAM domain-containing protein [Candidatus Nanoarchaeia archaeon]